MHGLLACSLYVCPCSTQRLLCAARRKKALSVWKKSGTLVVQTFVQCISVRLRLRPATGHPLSIGHYWPASLQAVRSARVCCRLLQVSSYHITRPEVITACMRQNDTQAARSEPLNDLSLDQRPTTVSPGVGRRGCSPVAVAHRRGTGCKKIASACKLASATNLLAGMHMHASDQQRAGRARGANIPARPGACLRLTFTGLRPQASALRGPGLRLCELAVVPGWLDLSATLWAFVCVHPCTLFSCGFYSIFICFGSHES